MVLYLLSLALHGQSIVSGDPYKAVRKSRRQMIWRLMLVGSLVVLGLKIPGVEAVSMFIGIRAYSACIICCVLVAQLPVLVLK